MKLKYDEYQIFRGPWRSTHTLPTDWMLQNYEDIVLHPKKIVARSLPLQEFRVDSCGAVGVYFLILCNRIVYVGVSAESVSTRTEKHAENKIFDSVSVIPLTWERHYLEMVESVYIEWFYPFYNNRFQKAKQLKPLIPLLESIYGNPRNYLFEVGDVSNDEISNTVALMRRRGLQIVPRDCAWKRESRQKLKYPVCESDVVAIERLLTV